MSNNQESMIFVFETILRVLAKEIYDNPLASLRENLQNAVDAIRVRNNNGDHFTPSITIKLSNEAFEIMDNGNGMSRKDLHTLYWAVGKSGKAKLQDICIGTFGVGALANFGIANVLEVTSRPSRNEKWIRSKLSWDDIRNTPEGTTPKIKFEEVETIEGNNDIGTCVKVQFLSSLDVTRLKQAESYISNHVAGLDIPVKINGEIISGSDWYAIPTEFTEREKGSSEWKIFNKNVHVDYTIYENTQGELSVKFISQFLSGISLPSKKPCTIFKRGFKLCDYQPDVASDLQFHLLVDCWYFSPTAGRDTLSPESADELDRLVSYIESVLLTAASKNDTRIRSLHGIFEKLRWTWSDYTPFNNLNVHRVMGDDITLVKIKELTEGVSKSVFFTIQNSRSAQTLAGRGHVVVLLPSNYFERECITRYLTKEYSAKDASQFDAIMEMISIESLDEKEKAALASLRHELSEYIGNSKLKVVPAMLKEDVMFHWPQNPIEETETVYCNIKHNHIINVLSQKGFAYSEMLWDLFMVEMGEQAINARRKVYGKDDASIQALIESRFRPYQLTLQDIQRISSREQTVITFSDVQVVNADSDSDETPHKKIVFIESPRNKWNGRGCYLRLEPNDHEDIAHNKDLYENLYVWVTGNVVNYYIRYGNISVFKLSLEFNQLIEFEDNSHAFLKEVTNESLNEQRRLLFLDDRTYIPVHPKLEPHIVPNTERQVVRFLVRAKPFSFKDK
jgi:hypothetical protein